MDNVLFYHGRTTDNRRFTIAGRCVNGDPMILGAAVCSKKDAFVKRVGRLKAEGRICRKADRGRLVVENTESDLKAFISTVTQFSKLSSEDLLLKFHMDNKS